MALRDGPISQVEVEAEIIRLAALLEEETEAYEALAEGQAKAEATYKSAWAKTYLAKSGPVKEREAWAEYENSDALYEMKIAEGLLRAKQQLLISIRTNIDALRTLAANVRSMGG